MQNYLEYAAVAINAPAGYGKTEEIVQAVKRVNGKQLILTHTRAGVVALKKRFAKYCVDNEKYDVLTIAAFCLKWCLAYPSTAQTPAIEFNRVDVDYIKVYEGARRIFSQDWALNIITYSYTGVFVDEYQDCTQSQHAVFMKIKEVLPIRIFGDPLQGIFYWVKGDSLVNWKEFNFPIVEPLETPWRWQNSNPKLGKIFKAIRTKLYPALDGKNVELNLYDIQGCLKLVTSTNWNNGKYAYQVKGYQSIVYLTTVEKIQNSFSQHNGGFFQSDEKKDVSDLKRELIEIEAKEGPDKVLAILRFIEKGVTRVETELKSYITHLEKGDTDFKNIKNHKDVGDMLLEICKSGSHENILNLLRWFCNNPAFKIYRKEYIYRIGKVYQNAVMENISIEEAIDLLNNNNHFMETKNNYSRLSSRTVLTKGLEFECAIVDARKEMDVRDFYVAMTRATKFVYIITDKSQIMFSGIPA